MQDREDWRTGRSCLYKIFYHLVFVTKYRRGALSEDMLLRLEEVYQETCEQMGGELLKFSGEADHVHLMVSAAPKTALSNLVGKLKGKSSYILRKEYPEELEGKLWGEHLWSPSYCAVTCGGAPLDIVKEYVETQQRPPSPRSIRHSIRAQKQHQKRRDGR